MAPIAGGPPRLEMPPYYLGPPLERADPDRRDTRVLMASIVVLLVLLVLVAGYGVYRLSRPITPQPVVPAPVTTPGPSQSTSVPVRA
jgi:hypothetical protein